MIFFNVFGWYGTGLIHVTLEYHQGFLPTCPLKSVLGIGDISILFYLVDATPVWSSVLVNWVHIWMEQKVFKSNNQSMCSAFSAFKGLINTFQTWMRQHELPTRLVPPFLLAGEIPSSTLCFDTPIIVVPKYEQNTSHIWCSFVIIYVHHVLRLDGHNHT